VNENVAYACLDEKSWLNRVYHGMTRDVKKFQTKFENVKNVKRREQNKKTPTRIFYIYGITMVWTWLYHVFARKGKVVSNSKGKAYSSKPSL